MEVDIILEPDLSPGQVSELGQKAEKYGIRALWSSNYFAHWDCFMSLLPLAQSTSRLLLGPLAVSPFEMHPLKIANSLLSLNELSGGRALIAMGAGEGNIDCMGIQRPEKIVRAVREGIEIVRGAGPEARIRGSAKVSSRSANSHIRSPRSVTWAPIGIPSRSLNWAMDFRARVSTGF